MRNPARRKPDITAIKRPLLIKGLLILFLLCIIIKAVLSMVSAALTDSAVSRLFQDGKIAAEILSFELGDSAASVFTDKLAEYGLISKQTVSITEAGDYHINSPDLSENPQGSLDRDNSALIMPGSSDNDPGLFFAAPSDPDKTDTSSDSPSENLPPPNNKSSAGIIIDNTTSQSIDIEELLNSPLNIKLEKGQPAVLIIHTHTSEAYTKTDGNDYVESDPFRTEDKSKNITRVGEELARELEARGISVIHDRRSYDYPSYTGSYNRTYSAVQAYLREYPSIKLVIDVHRDSIEAADGSQYKTLAQIGDTTCSQVMFVVGSNDAGLEHPQWRENLKLAFNLQAEMNELYPSLARPVRISKYRYNQNLTTGSLILEVGCAGNTLEESLTAVKYFADAAANVFLGFYS